LDLLCFICQNHGFSKRYGESKWLFSPLAFFGSDMRQGPGWFAAKAILTGHQPRAFDSHCTRDSGFQEGIVEKGDARSKLRDSCYLIDRATRFCWRVARRQAMATITSELQAAWTPDPGPLRCPRCHGALRGTDAGFACSAEGCGANLLIRNGVLVVRDRPSGDNKIAADFYNSELWPKVRSWERLFWVLNGGERKARDVVLRRLPNSPGVRLLDVAIGDGVYTGWLPEDWSIVGVDVSTAQLARCRRRNASRNLRLILGEAEDMPFRDREFDAVLSNGGFNHFNDPEEALREMARVAKPGAPVVIADEAPDFLDVGHRLGLPGLDRWIASRLMSMGDDFAGLIERHRNIDIAAIGRRVLNNCRYEVIWRGGGYVMVGAAP
jgi:SAM-dependent methyltransferase